MALLTRPAHKGKAEAADAKAAKISKKEKAEQAKPFVATLPMVDLLSAEVQEVIEEQRLKRLFLILGLVAVGAIAAVWAIQAGMIAVAEKKLAAEKAESLSLSAQQSALAPVAIYYKQVENNKFVIQTTMANEVLISSVVSRINQVTPAGIELASIAVSLDDAVGGLAPIGEASTCPSADPYGTGAPSAGCVTVDGTAPSRAVLGDWLDSVHADDMFTVAFIPGTTADAGNGSVTFTATMGLDAEVVHVDRYSEPDFLKVGTN